MLTIDGSHGEGGGQIIRTAPDYSYALVGEPGRRYLWVLSRTPQMDQATYRQLTESAAAQGFDINKLVLTKHEASNLLLKRGH